MGVQMRPRGRLSLPLVMCNSGSAISYSLQSKLRNQLISYSTLRSPLYNLSNREVLVKVFYKDRTIMRMYVHEDLNLNEVNKE